jgi:DNA polymerase III alpha subunit
MHEKIEDIPDIDIDFPAHIRDEIFDKIFNKYEGRVARISNHIKFREKSALKQAIRNKGYNKFIPKDFELEDIFDEPNIQYEILEEADNLIGQFRCYSLHCAGIIIFQDKVPEEYYLKDFIISKKSGNVGSQLKLNKDEVEDYNMIKIDILSNRGLSQLWEISQIPIEKYNNFDTNIYKIFCDGNTLGITYGESRGMRKIFMTMKPKNIEDIACALALIRPAASSNNQKFNAKKLFRICVSCRFVYVYTKEVFLKVVACSIHQSSNIICRSILCLLFICTFVVPPTVLVA